MVKVLHLGQMVGGLDIYVRNSIVYMSDEFDFIVVRSDKDQTGAVLKNNHKVKDYTIKMYRQLNPLNDCIALIQAIRIIMKERPDVIHCHSAKGGFIGRWAGFLTGVRTLYTPHAFSFLCTESGWKKRVFIWLERMARLNSYLLACSESEQKLGIDVVHYRKERALVWHNAVPDAAQLVPKSGTIRPYLCYVGRPSYQKNTFFLLDVMKEVHQIYPDVKLFLLGVGYYSPDSEMMKQKISEYGLENTIEIFSWLSHEKTLEYMRDSLFYLTVSRYEGLPISVIETMALGKAIVASDVVGNKDCVQNSVNGYLLPLYVKVFAEKICLLISDSKRRDEMGEKSRALFESLFYIDNRIKVLEEIYKNK